MIKLRDMKASDESMILAWRNLPEVGKYMYTDGPISPETHAQWLAKTLAHSSDHYWVIVCDEQDVGLANISDVDTVNRRCFWAFYIASSDVRGKGVGSFVEYFILSHVFDVLKLNKLCCEVLGFNEAVVNMHKRFGFRQEGVYRQHIAKGSVFHDVVALAMLREEWIAEKPKLTERLRQKGLIA